MSRIPTSLSHYKAILFDVDGVLSCQTTTLTPDGLPSRTMNVRDGYAIATATKHQELILGIITGGKGEQIINRYTALGMNERFIYMNIKHKREALHDFCQKTGITPNEIIYCGDDLPDLDVMRLVGLSVAPADASPEVLSIAHYISPKNGGEGVARDILEQVMKEKGIWPTTAQGFGW